SISFIVRWIRRFNYNRHNNEEQDKRHNQPTHPRWTVLKEFGNKESTRKNGDKTGENSRQSNATAAAQNREHKISFLNIFADQESAGGSFKNLYKVVGGTTQAGETNVATIPAAFAVVNVNDAAILHFSSALAIVAIVVVIMLAKFLEVESSKERVE